MAYAPFDVTITQVSGALFQGKVSSLTLPATSGVTTILAHHEPLITLLRDGTVTITTPSGEMKEYPITGGVAEVSNNQATVLL